MHEPPAPRAAGTRDQVPWTSRTSTGPSTASRCWPSTAREPAPGEWLVVHSGYAIDRVDAADAEAVASELQRGASTTAAGVRGEDGHDHPLELRARADGRGRVRSRPERREACPAWSWPA